MWKKALPVGMVLFGWIGCGGGSTTPFAEGGGDEPGTISGIQASNDEPVVDGETCSLPKVVGPCEAAMAAFWFNNETQECEEFSYGGCEGNDNRFESLEACESACVQAPGGETSGEGEAGENGDSPSTSEGFLTCLEENCTDSLEACEGDEVCVPVLACMEECGDDGDCIEACFVLDLSSLGTPVAEMATCLSDAGCFESLSASDEGGETTEGGGEATEEGGETTEEGGETTEAGGETNEEGGETNEEGGGIIEIPEGVDELCYLECMEQGKPKDYCFGLCRIETEEGGGDPGEEGGDPGEGGGGGGPLANTPLAGLTCVMPELGLGAGSYHFLPSGEAYISYENAPPSWTFDNGEKYPDKKFFINLQYDAEANAVYGAIDWTDSGTTVDGAVYWAYGMGFSPTFQLIDQGGVDIYGPNSIYQYSVYYYYDLYYECSYGD